MCGSCAGPTSVEDVLAASGDVDRGERVWDARCARCHGPNGAGTEDGADLTDRPLTDAQIAERVVEGWGTMEGFADRLSVQRTADVVAWVQAEIVP